VSAAVLVAVAVVVAGACSLWGSNERYRDEVVGEVVAIPTVPYATAPAEGSGGPVDLVADLYVPGDDVDVGDRPVLVMVHGGGYSTGSPADLVGVARSWAARGYVVAAPSYRLDPRGGCGPFPSLELGPDERAAEQQRCEEAATNAQHDIQATIRWLRANAPLLGIDPDRIAVMGFSAGGHTAVHVAKGAGDPGDTGEQDGESSAVAAAIAVSGCADARGGRSEPGAPLFLVASERDPYVLESCVRDTEDATRRAGGVVEARYYPDSTDHALGLYRGDQPTLDRQFAAFLARHLDLPPDGTAGEGATGGTGGW
jgi:acetyl esterase/lipase